MLTSLSIKHYRGFYNEEIIYFAEPNKKNGSGLTVFVGPNNTGKTTIIETLVFDENKKFKESERHKDETPIINIASESGICTYTNIDGGSQIRSSNTNKVKLLFELISSRRHWEPYAVKTMTSDQFQNSTTQQKHRMTPEVDVASRLKTINEKKDEKDKLNEYLKKILPNITSWTIDTDDQGDYVKYKTPNGSHKANLLGDGVISIFRICAHLVEQDLHRILIIDEPELSLHPTAQKALAKILSMASQDRQIIVSTHSTYFTNWDDLINGAKFVRFNKHNDEKCSVTLMDSKKEYSRFIGTRLSEYQKPQLLDTVAKEILFSEKILFLEGQEDVGLIRKWIKENNIDINFELFAYGVGGYGNMPLFLELAQDLKLSKVGALYDNEVDSYQTCKEKFTKYLIQKLPTNDIRDKPLSCDQCGRTEKIGIFDVRGNVKEDKKKEFETIMINFIDYFNGS